MSIERIELRKKYYDCKMVGEAVMSVTDDYNTIMKLLQAFADQPPLPDAVEVVRCKDCKYGEQDEIGRWFCRSFGCPVGNDDGSGFCADGERREDETD